MSQKRKLILLNHQRLFNKIKFKICIQIQKRTTPPLTQIMCWRLAADFHHKSSIGAVHPLAANVKEMRCMSNEYSDISGVIQSVLISDYQRTNKLPSVNELLDWRLRLVELKAENKKWVEYPEGWFDKEIEAVVYLLSLHSV